MKACQSQREDFKRINLLFNVMRHVDVIWENKNIQFLHATIER
jgi:hypothetical protein